MVAENKIVGEQATDLEHGVIQTLEIQVKRHWPENNRDNLHYHVRFVRQTESDDTVGGPEVTEDRVEGGGQLMWTHTEPHHIKSKKVQADVLEVALEAADYIEEHYDETVDTGLISR